MTILYTFMMLRAMRKLDNEKLIILSLFQLIGVVNQDSLEPSVVHTNYFSSIETMDGNKIHQELLTQKELNGLLPMLNLDG
jgi:hypothetical protein